MDRDYQDLMRRTQWQLDEYNKLDEKLEEEKAAKNRIEGHLKNLMMRLKEQLQIRSGMVYLSVRMLQKVVHGVCMVFTPVPLLDWISL